MRRPFGSRPPVDGRWSAMGEQLHRSPPSGAAAPSDASTKVFRLALSSSCSISQSITAPHARSLRCIIIRRAAGHTQTLRPPALPPQAPSSLRFHRHSRSLLIPHGPHAAAALHRIPRSWPGFVPGPSLAATTLHLGPMLALRRTLPLGGPPSEGSTALLFVALHAAALRKEFAYATRGAANVGPNDGESGGPPANHSDRTAGGGSAKRVNKVLLERPTGGRVFSGAGWQRRVRNGETQG